MSVVAMKNFKSEKNLIIGKVRMRNNYSNTSHRLKVIDNVKGLSIVLKLESNMEIRVTWSTIMKSNGKSYHNESIYKI